MGYEYVTQTFPLKLFPPPDQVKGNMKDQVIGDLVHIPQGSGISNSWLERGDNFKRINILERCM